MANGPALSTAKGGEIYIGNENRDSLLDVLYANQFEGESFDRDLIEQTEENFYRGAPPKWLTFHIGDQAASDGTGTPVIKRDGYDGLVQQIQTARRRPGSSTVKLLHQPGCGGTTLAMQVLWGLRKRFRSAVLTSPTIDAPTVAGDIIHLYTAGRQGHQNTVLLLINGKHNLEDLHESIMMEIAERRIVTHMPVVIILNCIQKGDISHSDHVVLENLLSETEVQNFNEKKKELIRRYGEKYNQFHGFKIMQSNFAQADIQETCAVLRTIKSKNKPLKTQLAAFLSLLNAYVPGSYLLESQCLDFLKRIDTYHGDLSLEARMEPFSHLIITYQQDTRSEKIVRMAHPMIAQCCTELMAGAGVTRSDTVRNFLTNFCRDEVPPFVVGFIKDMLTKRETKKENQLNKAEIKEEKFSRLIQEIQVEEGKKQSASVLKVASSRFQRNPFFPQALARFYYIELNDYNLAEMWAKRAIIRDPMNSFVADTLGQIYKNSLKFAVTPREVLHFAKKATEAFMVEEDLARNEHGTDMREDGRTKVSYKFNIRGQFGYVQVCNMVYDHLVNQNEDWGAVLTKKVSMGSVLQSLQDNKLFRFSELIRSFQDEVERKCAFLDRYLTYSKPDKGKEDPSYIAKDISACHTKYVGEAPSRHFEQEVPGFIQLKQYLADISAVVLSCIDKEYTESKLEEITTWLKEIALHSSSNPSTAFSQELPLRPDDVPEFHMLTLLLCWPTDSKAECVFDLGQLIGNMQRSSERTYKTYFRSRYLHPVFFIGQGQGLRRIIHRKVVEELHLAQYGEAMLDWSNDKMFQNPVVQRCLLRIEGVVHDFKVYASIDGKEIEVEANLRRSLWIKRPVSFYLGFTIRGPVAFDIQTKPAENGAQSGSTWEGSDQQGAQHRGHPGHAHREEN